MDNMALPSSACNLSKTGSPKPTGTFCITQVIMPPMVSPCFLTSFILGIFVYWTLIGVHYGIYRLTDETSYCKYRASRTLLKMGYSFPLKAYKNLVFINELGPNFRGDNIYEFIFSDLVVEYFSCYITNVALFFKIS